MIDNPKVNPPLILGHRIRLRPIQKADASSYAKATPIETFKYFVTQIPKEQSEIGFQSYVDYIIDTPSIQGFTCELIETGRVIGGSTFLDIRTSDDHVEIGMTWYSPEFRGTFVNPECKLLMLEYAFEVLGCKKVTLKCDNRNDRSKAAISKLGATHEGILRCHRYTEFGDWRDTSYYGILAEEWPKVKSNLQQRLRSFDEL